MTPATRESALASVRDVVAAIELDIERLSRAGKEQDEPTVERLVASWAELVALLDVEPAPELRDCPKCHHSGRRNATLCGYCWTKLTPLS